MSSINEGRLIKEVRARKKLTQEKLMVNREYALSTISRAENKKQALREGTARDLLTAMEMKAEDFFCPYLYNATYGVYQMRSQILMCLDVPDDANAMAEAEKMIKSFETMDCFKNAINRQFLLSCRARLNEIKGGGIAATLKDVKDGIKATYREYAIEDLANDVLIFEEPELLHTYALTHKRKGNFTAAINLLKNICAGLEKLPEDDSEKEKQLAKVLLTLSECLMACKKYEQALAICIAGNGASLKYSRGEYTPWFLHNQAVCLLYTGHKAKSKKAFTLAYFAFSIFHKKTLADKVRKDAEEMAGFAINTYGVDKLVFAPIDYRAEYDLTPYKFNSIGAMLKAWRKEAGLTLKQLSQGICEFSYLRKIEENKVKQPNAFILEALTERLGRDNNQYFYTFVSDATFKEKQKRNEIRACLILHDYAEAEKLLAELESPEASEDFKKGVGLQFIKDAKASLMAKGVKRDEQYYQMVLAAIKITIPDFNENLISQYHLTHTEKMLINKLANYYGENGNMRRALKITETLLDNVNNKVIDEPERLRSVIMLLYSFSRKLGKLGQRHDELKYAEDGIKIGVKQRAIINLPGLYINKGIAVYHLTDLYNREESIPYLAMAYYGSALVNNEANKKAIADFVKTNLGITFD